MNALQLLSEQGLQSATLDRRCRQLRAYLEARKCFTEGFLAQPLWPVNSLVDTQEDFVRL